MWEPPPLTPENIDVLSKVLTQFIFRNGPVEGMHCDGKLSQGDMKTLNKYIVNRIADLLTALAEGNSDGLIAVYRYYRDWVVDWDPAEPDPREILAILENLELDGADRK